MCTCDGSILLIEYKNGNCRCISLPGTMWTWQASL
jgi:hypothetical protein